MENNPNEDILVDATIDQNKKLDELVSSSDVQVDGIIKTNEALSELNSTADLILEGISKQKPQPQVAPKIEIEVDGATIEVVEGPKGDKGEKGDKGDKGEIGMTGHQGEKGDKGEQGPAGLDGLNGVDGINGKDGKNGRNGINGLHGKDGKDGKDGNDITKEEIAKAVKESVNFDDIKDAPDVKDIVERVNKISSKTVSLVELDDVNLTGLTKTDGKYNLASGGGAVDSVNTQTGVVVLDTDDIAEGTNKYATAAEKAKLANITVTQAVNLDTIESDTTTNNAKVTNATHTGEVTGATALTIATAAVTNAKMANMATKTYKGRTTAGTGVPEDVSVATLKTDLSLNNVDNTSDANKPVSTATQTALNLKANLASPTFTGTVSGITSTMVGLGNVTNESKATMFTNAALTGNPTAPTATTTDNDTSIATTAFVQANKIGYNLQLVSTQGYVVTDSATNYFNGGFVGSTYTGGVVVAKTGTIKTIIMKLRVTGTLGTTENTSAYVSVNNTTDTLLSSTVKHDTAAQTYSFTGLNIAVTEGDDLVIKHVFPAFATNPTGNQLSTSIYIE